MHKYIFLLATLLACGSVTAVNRKYPAEVETALSQAGANRSSLERVLTLYARSGEREKYDAACYLISNMRWHTTGGRVIRYDQAVDSFIRAADRNYYRLINGTTARMQESDPLHKTIKETAAAAAKRFGEYSFTPPETTEELESDLRSVSGDFIRRQIEHAFVLRKKVERIRRMPFRDFCEYILPYRALNDYPLVTPADDIANIFSKYLQADTTRNYIALAERYNRATWWLRHSQGAYPFDTYLGFPDLFFTDPHDCVDKAEYGAQALRACGVPAVVEYNSAYRIWASRHYMVAVSNDKGEWLPYNPESGIPGTDGAKVYHTCLNIYRQYFGIQPGNPYCLAGDDEPIPQEFRSPTIKDVTALYSPVTSITIPAGTTFARERKLAYLASFQSGVGLTPVTWGTADADAGTVRFPTVVPDNLYFPAWYSDEGTLMPFGRPFSVRTDDKDSTLYKIAYLPASSDKRVPVTLYRKYPVKPHLAKQAEAAVGTVVLGSDTPNFEEADTLGFITEIPQPRWADLELNTHRPYKYYRVRAPKSDPHLRLAELQFLTRRAHGYANVITPYPLAGPQAAAADSAWVRLMDEPLDKCNWKAEYDNNVQTAPDRWPDVTLKLTEPQYVERLRYVAKHADNVIRPGDTYVLSEWNSKGWDVVWEKKADGISLPAGKLKVGGCYWLDNVDRGREELPFIVREDGTTFFPHGWIVADVEAGRH